MCPKVKHIIMAWQWPFLVFRIIRIKAHSTRLQVFTVFIMGIILSYLFSRLHIDILCSILNAGRSGCTPHSWLMAHGASIRWTVYIFLYHCEYIREKEARGRRMSKWPSGCPIHFRLAGPCPLTMLTIDQTHHAIDGAFCFVQKQIKRFGMPFVIVVSLKILFSKSDRLTYILLNTIIYMLCVAYVNGGDVWVHRVLALAFCFIY